MPATTAIVLVTRPDRAALAEAARSAGELAALGLGNQTLVVNGVFHASEPDDAVAQTIERTGRRRSLDDARGAARTAARRGAAARLRHGRPAGAARAAAAGGGAG